jgi:F0F1-type ATP synthase assembly protein I
MSKFLSLNWQDFGKGLLMAILTPVVVIIQQSIELGSWTFNWKIIGLSALSGGLAYLIKNFFTKPSGE